MIEMKETGEKPAQYYRRKRAETNPDVASQVLHYLPVFSNL
jgi:hypothetical protein